MVLSKSLRYYSEHELPALLSRAHVSRATIRSTSFPRYCPEHELADLLIGFVLATLCVLNSFCTRFARSNCLTCGALFSSMEICVMRSWRREYACVWFYTHTCMYMYVHVYVCGVCVCIYIYIYIYIYILHQEGKEILHMNICVYVRMS